MPSRPNPARDPVHQGPGGCAGRPGRRGGPELLVAAGLPGVPDARDGRLRLPRLPLSHVLAKVRGRGAPQEGVRHFRCAVGELFKTSTDLLIDTTA